MAQYSNADQQYTNVTAQRSAQQILQFSDASSNEDSTDDDQPISSVAAFPTNDSSDDDDDMSHFTKTFTQGSPLDGDATAFMKAFTKHVRLSRMSDWTLKKQAYACAAACDPVTEAAIEAAIEVNRFTTGGVHRSFERGVVPAGHDAAADAANIVIADGRIGSLAQFAEWFMQTPPAGFARQDATVEAREQVEVSLGQTEALAQHYLTFRTYLELMPQSRDVNGDIVLNVNQPHSVSHYLASTSSLLPAELEAAGFKPPRWHAENENAVTPFISVAQCHASMLTHEKPIALAARKLKLKQHWIDYEGRKHDETTLTKTQKKKMVGALMHADTPLTELAARTLMAKYADSAVAKTEARLETKFGGRIDAVENAVGSLESTFGTQMQTLVTTVQNLTTAVAKGKGSGKGSKGQKGTKGQYSNQSDNGQGSWGRQQVSQQNAQQWGQPLKWGNDRPVNGAPPQGPAGQWGRARKPIECWNCGGPHMARNCPNGLQNPDASRAEVRRGANAVNLALTGAGELSSDELVEDFGSLEVARQWVAAVYDATEVWVAALSAPGDTDCTHTALTGTGRCLL